MVLFRLILFTICFYFMFDEQLMASLVLPEQPDNLAIYDSIITKFSTFCIYLLCPLVGLSIVLTGYVKLRRATDSWERSSNYNQIVIGIVMICVPFISPFLFDTLVESAVTALRH